MSGTYGGAPASAAAVTAMLTWDAKCEIEALNSAAHRTFFTDVYIPWKLQRHDWL